MDVDLWASRVHAAKSLSAAHAARLHYDEEDKQHENSEEVVNQEVDELVSLNLRISDYERYLEGLENLRVQLLQEAAAEGIPFEVDASSVVIHGGEDDNEEPTYQNSFNEDNHMAMEDSEGDDDAKSCFPCPFCYMDIEVPMLCSHLEEEHCFDCKNAVCPLCAANLGKDVIGHFMVHHASSFKHRRKAQKSGLWTGSSAMLGKALLKNGRAYAQESAPDPLLSPFICNMSFSDPTDIPQDVCSDITAPITSGTKRAGSSSPGEGCEKDNEERRQRSAFVQQLISSTIFLDL